MNKEKLLKALALIIIGGVIGTLLAKEKLKDIVVEVDCTDEDF